MIEISEKSKSKLEELVGEYYVLTDFDRTITAIDSESSWGILSKSHCAPEEYVKERQRLYDYYRPIEIDLTLDYKEKNRLMNEWWTKHINLLTKYKLKESIIDQVVTDDKMMKFRKGAREFLEKLHQYNIPVIIISAGIGNFIKKFLIKNNALYDNIYIIANFIEFENGIAVGVKGRIIHSLNKNECALNDKIKSLIYNKSYALVLGDSVDDIKMIDEKNIDKAVKIGFLDKNNKDRRKIYAQYFDVVCDGDTSFEELNKCLKLFRKS